MEREKPAHITITLRTGGKLMKESSTEVGKNRDSMNMEGEGFENLLAEVGASLAGAEGELTAACIRVSIISLYSQCLYK